MSATAAQDYVDGFEAIILDNSRIRASVIPSLGRRVWDLLDQVRGRQYLIPCTNMPNDLVKAVQAGQSARLDAGGVFQTCVDVTLRPLKEKD